MARTLEESLLEQVQALKSKIDEVMASHTDKEDDYGDFMRPSPTEPESRVPESSQTQVVVDVHEKCEDEDMPSVEVVQEAGVVQVEDLDKHGVQGKQVADEPPVVIPEPKCPEMGLKQVYGVELSPEDKTTYSTVDSPIKPHVLRPRSPVRARIFPPRQKTSVYKGYYPESPEVQYSTIRPRADTCPDPFVTQR